MLSEPTTMPKNKWARKVDNTRAGQEGRHSPTPGTTEISLTKFVPGRTKQNADWKASTVDKKAI
jgi:hypothetical protein